MGTRILVIDDMPEITMLVSLYLTDMGYEVITAENGEEALELLQLTPVSLIICDIMMPKMGGFLFIEQCRKLYSNHIPIIIVSAKSRSSIESIALELGVNGFLEKPLNLDLLAKAVDSTLSKLVKAKESSEEEKEFIEKRQHTRVPFFCEAKYKAENFSGVTVITSISRGGCNLETNNAFPIGTLLSLKLKVHPGYTIEVFGEVRYSIAKSSTGIKFFYLDEEAGDVIDNIVIKLSSTEKIFELETQDYSRKLIDSVVDNFNLYQTNPNN